MKYVFKVSDLFNDLQDGILLCRLIQLLTHDPCILKVGLLELKMLKDKKRVGALTLFLLFVGQKVVIPSDDRKKNMVNCEISLKYLKKIGVPLCDEDGIEIITEDIVSGDKELIISLLWNIFAHLQV